MFVIRTLLNRFMYAFALYTVLTFQTILFVSLPKLFTKPMTNKYKDKSYQRTLESKRMFARCH